MAGHAGVGAYELRVLNAVGPGSSTSQEVATRLREPLPEVHHALIRVIEAGLAEADEGRIRLTEVGRQVAAGAAVTGHPEEPVLTARVDADPVGDLVDVAQTVGSAWISRAQQAAAERDADLDALLASDADRDQAVQQLAQAFSEGRLASAELDERTGRALAARTYGELEEVLVGLGGLVRPVRRHPVRAAVFWVATVLLSPFLLFGTLFALFGSDVGDHLAGLVVLALTAPPLFGLWRWARPRG